jgi:hypothetical protein
VASDHAPSPRWGREGGTTTFWTAWLSLAEAASSIGAIEELMREQDEALRSLLEQVLSEVCES